jgi:hypothetical protein
VKFSFIASAGDPAGGLDMRRARCLTWRLLCVAQAATRHCGSKRAGSRLRGSGSDEAKADVFDYVERLYNARRRHPAIG